MALLTKELQLHQSQFVMAGALFLLHLGVIAARKFGDFKDSPGTEFVLSAFWVLWFAMPLVVGCAAVAEERKLGTLESQLCLPVRRRTQFWIKLGSALLLSVVFGFLMPLLFEGKRILPTIEMKAAGEIVKNFPNDAFVQSVGNAFLFIGEILPTLIPLGILVVILTVSFYASTLSRNTLQSLAPAVLGIAIAFMLLIGAGNVEKVFHYPLWRGWLIYIIGVPILTLTILALMKWNFKQVWIGWKVARRNATVFVAALSGVIIVTTAIYHRAWEYLTPIEPAHGIVRLEKTAAQKMESWGWRSTILLANGQAWSAWPSFSAPKFSSVFLGDWNLELKSGGFWNGSNWTSVASSYFDDIGIKADGSLWVSQEPRKPSEFRKASSAHPLVRVDDKFDWKSVSVDGRKAFLLKTDGTLWGWGENINDRKKEWPGLRAFEPERLGTNSDWVETSQADWTTVFRNEDGQAWVYGRTSTDAKRMKLNEETTLYRAEYLDRTKSVTEAWAGNRFIVGVQNSGTLVASGDFGSRRYRPEETGIQLGKETNWVAIAGRGETVVALKADGSLWKWKFTDDPITKPESASAIRLGKHSDWIAIADQFGGLTSLAADGSLWFWRSDDPRYSSASAQTIPPLLAASRRPLRIGNIFDATASSRKK